MAFPNYKTIAQVQQEFNIKYVEKDFVTVTDLTPSAEFVRELEFNLEHVDVFSSEASRCENVIYPILREVYKKFANRYTLWSHKSISVDETLTGTPDYLLATKSELGKTVLGLPILVVVEAKQNNFVEGWGQCLAELVAVQRLNETTDEAVYGIVTDGQLWQFGRLVADLFTKHKTPLTIADLGQLFGAVEYLYQARKG